MSRLLVIAAIGGLIAATILTLIVPSTLYVIVQRRPRAATHDRTATP